MKAKLVRPLIMVFAALMLSACRVVVDTKINDNGSGELCSSVVFSAEEKANFEGSPENAGKSVCDNLKEGSQADTEFVEEVRGDETFCTTVRSFANLNELRGFYDGMGNVTVNELKIELIRLTFDVQLGLTPKGDNEPAANEWRLTLPGEIEDNNAESIEGQTLIWVMIGLAVLLGVVSILLLRRRS